MLNKLYTFSDERYAPVKKQFLSSLKDDYKVIWTPLPTGADPLKFRNHLIKNAIEENMGEAIVYCDIDTQFFAPTKSLFEDLIEFNKMASQYDPFSQEHQMGSLVIRCDALTLRFATELVRSGEEVGPLKSYRSLLSRNYINWRRMPEKIWHENPNSNRPIPRNIVSHHVGGSFYPGDILKKMDQISQLVSSQQTDIPRSEESG